MLAMVWAMIERFTVNVTIEGREMMAESGALLSSHMIGSKKN
jgi:hypothetical protein